MGDFNAGGAGTGALSGAALGTAIMPGIGTAIGAIGGGLFGSGLLSGDPLGVQSNYHTQNPYSQQYLQELANRQSQIYGGQLSLGQALQQQMAGQGPNPAQTQYMGNTQNNIANAQGMIASQRGLDPALAARMGVNAASNANQQAALGSALVQQQQQLGATANLGNLYGQMQQGNVGYQGNYIGAQNNADSINAGVASGNAGRNAQLTGGLLNAAGGAGAAFINSGGLKSTPSTSTASPNYEADMAAAHNMSQGGYVHGGQAKVPGDSPKNDTVHAMLSPGEIVVPRSMAHDPEKAKEFIDHLLKGEKKTGDYGEVVKARRKKAGK